MPLRVWRIKKYKRKRNKWRPCAAGCVYAVVFFIFLCCPDNYRECVWPPNYLSIWIFYAQGLSFLDFWENGWSRDLEASGGWYEQMIGLLKETQPFNIFFRKLKRKKRHAPQKVAKWGCQGFWEKNTTTHWRGGDFFNKTRRAWPLLHYFDALLLLFLFLRIIIPQMTTETIFKITIKTTKTKRQNCKVKIYGIILRLLNNWIHKEGKIRSN